MKLVFKCSSGVVSGAHARQVGTVQTCHLHSGGDPGTHSSIPRPFVQKPMAVTVFGPSGGGALNP